MNEEAAIGPCLEELARAERALGKTIEAIVVDNGSTDGSAAAAHRGLSAFRWGMLIDEPRKGYGNAYRSGFAVARAPYIFMADGDGSYDLNELPRFFSELESGAGFVIGDRLAGDMQKGSMPFAHRYIGNPVLSAMLRALFHCSVRDAHCGMRAFRRELLDKADLRASGMEFASEMVIQFSLIGTSIVELPISYRPRAGASKLRPIRDGLRHVFYMLDKRFSL